VKGAGMFQRFTAKITRCNVPAEVERPQTMWSATLHFTIPYSMVDEKSHQPFSSNTSASRF